MAIKHFSKQLCLLLALSALLGAQTVGALSQDQMDAYNKGIYYFDTEACTVSLGSVSLLGSDNVEKAYNFFVQKGMPAIGAAGIVGNLMTESGVNPKSISNDGKTIGIAQWEGGRDDNLRAFAAKENLPYDDLGVQLDFLWQEANASYKEVVQHVHDATSPEDAATQWMGPGDNGRNRTGGFENPSSQYANESTRRSNAAAVYKRYGGSAVTAGGVTTSASSSSCGGGSPYTSSDFPLYSQCDPKWGNNPYGGDNICGSGCGPTAMAMIVTALTRQNVTPDILASYYHSKGFDSSGATSWAAAPDAAKKYGLTATPLGTDTAKISAALQSGSLVIMAGKGGLPFTSAGHFVVVRGVTSDGKWLLGDPDTAAGHSNTESWDPAQVIAGVINNGGGASVYAISK